MMFPKMVTVVTAIRKTPCHHMEMKSSDAGSTSRLLFVIIPVPFSFDIVTTYQLADQLNGGI